VNNKLLTVNNKCARQEVENAQQTALT